jgi:uncharacterized protein YbjT (DUF2867 family)
VKCKLGAEVEVVAADITRPETLFAPVTNVDHIIFTAGVTKRPAGERPIMTTEYEGVKNTLAPAQCGGFGGRFLYMTSIGITQSSLAATVLNFAKRNTLLWRKRTEEEIRRSELAYTIIRAGFLTNAQTETRPVEMSQHDYPLTFKYRIARANVAEAFVQALKHSNTARTTLEITRATGAQRRPWEVLFHELKPDA